MRLQEGSIMHWNPSKSTTYRTNLEDFGVYGLYICPQNPVTFLCTNLHSLCWIRSVIGIANTPVKQKLWSHGQDVRVITCRAQHRASVDAVVAATMQLHRELSLIHI